MISFTVYDLTLSCLEGMTWGEFIDSDYNNDDFKYSTLNENAVAIRVLEKDGNRDREVMLDYDNLVYVTDVIIPNHNYVLQE